MGPLAVYVRWTGLLSFPRLLVFADTDLDPPSLAAQTPQEFYEVELVAPRTISR